MAGLDAIAKQTESGTEADIGLKDYLWIFRRRGPLMAAVVAAVLVFAAALAFLSPRTYQASAFLIASRYQAPDLTRSSLIRPSDIPLMTDVLEATQIRLVETHVEVIKRTSILMEARAALSPELRRYFSDDLDELRRQVSAEKVEPTDVIQVSVKAQDREAAAALANAICARYADYTRDYNQQASQQAAQILRSQLDELRSQIKGKPIAPDSAVPAPEPRLWGRGESATSSRTPFMARTGEELEQRAMQETYSQLYQRYRDLLISGQARLASVRLLTSAAAPTIPYSPRKKRIAAIALIFGVLLALGLALLLEYASDSVRRSATASEISGSPVLGELPVLSKAQVQRADDLGGEAKASFDLLASNVALAMEASAAKSLLVTSAGKREGRSTLASGLARALAEQGRPATLVVAADGKSIAEARKESGLVIVDGPPASSAAAQLLASQVDAVLLVVSAWQTGRGALARAVRNLRLAHARLLGVIFNRSPFA